MKPKTFRTFNEAKNIDKLIELVEDEDFTRRSLRENLENQKNTRIIIGYFGIRNDIEPFGDMEVVNKYYPYVQDVIESVKSFYNYRNIIIKGFNIVKLLAYSEISNHTDEHGYYPYCHRIHIPIITNSECKFTVLDDTRNFKCGEVFELNNIVDHSVINKGDSRVHLILDIQGFHSYFENINWDHIPDNFYGGK